MAREYFYYKIFDDSDTCVVATEETHPHTDFTDLSQYKIAVGNYKTLRKILTKGDHKVRFLDPTSLVQFIRNDQCTEIANKIKQNANKGILEDTGITL